MPRPEGIATFAHFSVIFSSTLSRNECPDQRGLRPEGVTNAVLFTVSRNECPDQRGLRHTFCQDGPEGVQRAGTNAPTRGDCDRSTVSHLWESTLGRNECPDQRGLRRSLENVLQFVVIGRNECPDQRGLRPVGKIVNKFFQISRNECPDQRGLRQIKGTTNDTKTKSRNECPDQRGLRLGARIASGPRVFLAGTNAPTRGDCDPSMRPQFPYLTWAGTNAPTRGDCDHVHVDWFCKTEYRPERMPRPEGIATCRLVGSAPFIGVAGTNAPTRGDCDFSTVRTRRPIFISRNECPDQRGVTDRPYGAISGSR